MLLNKFFQVVILGLLLCSPFSVYAQTGRIALVIDDLGNQLRAGKATIDIPFVTTLAIMPGRPYSGRLADYAHAANKEVIVHLPMSNMIDFPLGEFGLAEMEDRSEFSQIIRDAIATVPHSVGLSNHMGSRLTQDYQSMAWLMSVLRQENFYFFDSRTVHTTIAWQVARDYRVPWAMRNIFLDHEQTTEFIAQQWAKALERALQGEDVAVIGHPYPETIEFLQSLSAESLSSIEFVPLSSFLNYPSLYQDAPRASDGLWFMLR